MKRLPLIVFVGLVAFAVAQDRLVFRDRKKDPRVQIEGNQGFFIPDKSFELSGNVVVRQLVDKLTMSCQKATGDLVKVTGKTEFDNVHLTGGVQVDQIGQTSSFGATGSKADYDLKDSLRHLNLGGNVVLDFSGESDVKADPKKQGSKPGKKSSTLNVKATDADVTFKKITKDNKESIEVQAVTVTGPIQFNGNEVTKVEGKTSTQKFTARADRMTFRAKGESGNAEVRLTGNLEIHQQDDSGDGPDIAGAKSLVLQLNDNYEIISIRFSSDGSGQIKTTFPPKGKGGR